MTTPQIEVAHLLAAAVDVLVLGSFHPKPEAVDLFCLFGHSQGDCTIFLGDQQLEPTFQIQLRSLRRHMGRSQRQRAALQQMVLQLEVAAVHLHLLLTAADIDHGGIGVGVQQHIAAVFQGKDPFFANDLHGCPFSAIWLFNSGVPDFRPASRDRRPA